MDIILTARELGKKLQETQEYKKMYEAKANNDLDSDLQEMIQNFNLKKVDFERKVSANEFDEETEREKNKEIMSLYNEIMSNPTMAEYIMAKNELNQIVKQINSILMMAVNGADPETCDISTSCGSGCSSCGGC